MFIVPMIWLNTIQRALATEQILVVDIYYV